MIFLLNPYFLSWYLLSVKSLDVFASNGTETNNTKEIEAMNISNTIVSNKISVKTTTVISANSPDSIESLPDEEHTSNSLETEMELEGDHYIAKRNAHCSCQESNSNLNGVKLTLNMVYVDNNYLNKLTKQHGMKKSSNSGVRSCCTTTPKPYVDMYPQKLTIEDFDNQNDENEPAVNFVYGNYYENEKKTRPMKSESELNHVINTSEFHGVSPSDFVQTSNGEIARIEVVNSNDSDDTVEEYDKASNEETKRCNSSVSTEVPGIQNTSSEKQNLTIFHELNKSRNKNNDDLKQIPVYMLKKSYYSLPELSQLLRTQDAADESKQTRVLCYVMMEPYDVDRAFAIKATWGDRCDKLVLLTNVTDKSLPTVSVLMKQGARYQWGRTKRVLEYLSEHYQNDADWFLRADDAAYVMVENLRYLLAHYDSETSMMLGCQFSATSQNNGTRYKGDSVACILSNQALKRVVNAFKYPMLCATGEEGTDETMFARCLRNAGVISTDSWDNTQRGRFFPFFPRLRLFMNRDKGFWHWTYEYYPAQKGLHFCSDKAISFHYLSAEMMYVLDYLIYRLRPLGIKFDSDKIPDLLKTCEQNTTRNSLMRLVFNKNQTHDRNNLSKILSLNFTRHGDREGSNEKLPLNTTGVIHSNVVEAPVLDILWNALENIEKDKSEVANITNTLCRDFP